MSDPIRQALAVVLAPSCHLIGRVRSALGAEPRVRILLYHAIPDDALRAFERQVNNVVRDYHVITPLDFHRFMNGDVDLPPHSVLFSFDDGFQSSWMAAKRVLQPRGIRALFFVTVDFIDASGCKWPVWAAARLFRGRLSVAELSDAYAPMTWDDLAAVVAAGHTVGSHSLSHPSLASLDVENLSREIVESGDYLEQRLGVRVCDFAFPFGNLSSISGVALRIAGRRYRCCYSGLRGGNVRGQPRLAILREAATPNDSPAYVSLMLEGGLDWRRLVPTRRLRLMAAHCG